MCVVRYQHCSTSLFSDKRLLSDTENHKFKARQFEQNKNKN